MIGVMGVVFFVYNAAFALVLLVLVLVASVYAVVSKNPDTRYQPMRDDRGSFIKSQTQLTTELDALGATARGDMKSQSYQHNPFDEDSISVSSGRGNGSGSGSGSGSGNGNGYQHLNTANAPHSASQQPAQRSPIDPSVPLFPSDTSGRRGSPPGYDQVGGALPPSPAVRKYDNMPVGQSALAPNYRNQNSSSPWQRGAGYEH